MFTGLVETKGRLLRRTSQGRDARLVVEGDFGIGPGAGRGKDALVMGESIAVDGVCLTVAAIPQPGGAAGPSVFEADASAETLSRTTLGDLAVGGHVNLERAMPLGGRMGGHVVSGHVDDVGTIAAKEPVGAAMKVVFRMPKALARYVAQKGSICVSGVSLTVNGVTEDTFDVVLVPHTQDMTSLAALPVGARVNLEVDLLARYVARLLDAGVKPDSGSMLETLTRAGYV